MLDGIRPPRPQPAAPRPSHAVVATSPAPERHELALLHGGSLIPDERAILAHAVQAQRIDSLQRRVSVAEREREHWRHQHIQERERRALVEQHVQKLERQFVRHVNTMTGGTLTVTPGLSFTSTARPEYARLTATWRVLFTRRAAPLVSFFAAAMLLAGLIGGTALVTRGRLTSAAVHTTADQAVAALQSAVTAIFRGTPAAAQQDFAQAETSFAALNQELGVVRTLLAGVALLPGSGPLRDRATLLRAGERLARGGARVTGLLQSLNDLRVTVATSNTPPVPATLTVGRGVTSLRHLLDQARRDLPSAARDLERAVASLTKINTEALPTENQAQFAHILQVLPTVQRVLPALATLPERLTTFLGFERTQRYLVFFQNTAEARPSGGFLGTYALLDVRDGSISKLAVNGIYDPDGQLPTHVAAPEGLSRTVPRLFIRDANWWPDFPTSATKLTELFTAATGTAVDGVITVTPRVMQDLLRVTGPLPVPAYGVTLTAENFLTETQVQVEQKYDRAKNKPKQFLADVVPLLLQRLTADGGPTPAALAGLFYTALEEKDVLFSFQNEALQQFVAQQHWDGALNTTADDVLMVVNANIEGQKSDQFVTQHIQHAVTIRADGNVTEDVTVSRTHRETAAWPSGPNQDFLRLVVPGGSTLVGAKGFDPEDKFAYRLPCPECTVDPLIAATEGQQTIHGPSRTRVYPFLSRTVFANWLTTLPGATREATVQYSPPITVMPLKDAQGSGRGYSLVVQRQPGNGPTDYALTVRFPATWQVAWQGGTALTVAPGTLTWRGPLVRDRAFGIVFTTPAP